MQSSNQSTLQRFFAADRTRRAALQFIRNGIGAIVAWTAFPFRSHAASGGAAYPALYSDPTAFLDAISRERVELSVPLTVTGIGVPHHLLAADLIARGFWAAHGAKFERVVVFSPAHFNRSTVPLATTRKDFQTVFGTVENDVSAAISVIETGHVHEISDLFETEHGIHALLPFVKWFFPRAKVVAIAVAPISTRSDWDNAVAALRPLLGPKTLLVQSTDFSHYLRPEIALQRDQETLNVIAANDRDALTGLVHPDHLDSKGCQYIQMSLQAELGSSAVVIANRNSAEYVTDASITTSYIVEVYTNGPASRFPISYDDQQIFYFAGDSFLGRWMTQYLANPALADRLVAHIRSVTGGAPLVVNLEGTLLDEPPEGLPVLVHCMHASLAVPILRALNVRAANLANNHSFDVGDIGLNESIRILTNAGITPLLHGQCADLGPFRVLPLNFVGGALRPGYPLIHEDELESLCTVEGKPPILALVHWGREYTTTAQGPEYEIAAALHRCGLSAVIGAHSHQAAETIEVRQGGEYQLCFSLGNFLFDQHAWRSSAALLEVRAFNQKTFATRLVPLPNYFDLARTWLMENDSLQV
jgi:AmmeMemoRadiSam system protein B